MLGNRPGFPEEEALEARREALPKSKIYEADPTRWSPEEKALVSGLRKLSSDRKFHPISGLVTAAGSLSECFSEMSEMSSEGMVFERSGRLFRMRLRDPGEPLPELARLARELELAIDVEASIVEQASVKSPTVEGDTEDLSQADFNPEGDLVDSATDDLVLSDPPGDLSLERRGSHASTSAIFAKRGSGKTYLGGVLLEEIVGSQTLGSQTLGSQTLGRRP